MMPAMDASTLKFRAGGVTPLASLCERIARGFTPPAREDVGEDVWEGSIGRDVRFGTGMGRLSVDPEVADSISHQRWHLGQ